MPAVGDPAFRRVDSDWRSVNPVRSASPSSSILVSSRSTPITGLSGCVSSRKTWAPALFEVGDGFLLAGLGLLAPDAGRGDPRSQERQKEPGGARSPTVTRLVIGPLIGFSTLGPFRSVAAATSSKAIVAGISSSGRRPGPTEADELGTL